MTPQQSLQHEFDSIKSWPLSVAQNAAMVRRATVLQDVPVLGSSQVKVMFSSLSSGSVKALRMPSVNLRYPSAPGWTSKLYVLPSKLTFITAGALAPQVGVRVAFQSGSCPSQNSQCVSFLQDQGASITAALMGTPTETASSQGSKTKAGKHDRTA